MARGRLEVPGPDMTSAVVLPGDAEARQAAPQSPVTQETLDPQDAGRIDP